MTADFLPEPESGKQTEVWLSPPLLTLLTAPSFTQAWRAAEGVH